MKGDMLKSLGLVVLVMTAILVIAGADLFFLWRSYSEPGTNVGPDDNELLYDRAIYFGPYFEP